MSETRCPKCGFLTGTSPCPCSGPPITEKKSFLGEFFEGGAFLFRGLRYLLRRPGLYPHVIVPLILNVLLFGGAVILFYLGFDSFVLDRLVGWDGWFWGTLAVGFQILGALLLVALAFGLVLLLGPFLIKIPWAALLSERVEDQLEVVVPRDGGPTLLREAIDEVKLFSTELLILGPLFVLAFFLPFPGSLLLIVGQVYFAALNFIDLPLARRGYGIGEKHRLMRRHFWRTMGFGTAVLLAFLIPLFGFVIIPVASVGATLLYNRLPRKD